MIDSPMRDGAPARGRLDRRGVIGIVVMFALALLVAQSCQQSQIRISKEQAIASARQQVDFTPRRTQVRLVRQGLGARPYWAVSLSIPGRNGAFQRLATVRVDANTGEVAAVDGSARGR